MRSGVNLGSGGGLWEDATLNPPSGDVATMARMNQKTLYIGATEPSTTYAGMMWIDTSTSPITIRIRNAANTAFNTLPELLAGLITDTAAIHSYASATKSKVTEIDVTTLNGEVNVTYE